MFHRPWWLIAALPVLGAAWGLLAWAASRRRRVGAALGRAETLARAAEDAAAGRRLAAGLRLGAMGMILLALAGPRWGVELAQTRGAARQVVVAVDVSLSMRAADVSPSRLDRAKASLGLLLDQLRGERVGVVAFAGEAHVVCPLTSDVEAAKALLSALDAGAVPTPGTAVGGAIRVAAAMLGRYPGPKDVVLLTDGEDHRSDPLGAARQAAASGVRVFAVGIGSPQGEPIPLEGGGYKRDSRGRTVVSRLDEATLAEAARGTGGAYFRSTPGQDEIAEIAARIKSGAAGAAVAGTTARWRDRYAWPLAAAFALLCAELALGLAPPARAAVRLLPLLLLAASPARAATAEGDLRAGNRAYRRGENEEALSRYGRAAARRPKDHRPAFNAGDALYRLERPADAAAAFESVAAREDLPAPARAAALYNLGNARYRAGDFAGAADAYRRSLSLAPADEAARRNLAVALLRRKSPPPPRGKEKDKPDPKKPDEAPPKPQDQGGGSGAGPSKTRPQDALTREDAERVLRAVAEREKAAREQAARARGAGPRPPRPPSEEDW